MCFLDQQLWKYDPWTPRLLGSLGVLQGQISCNHDKTFLSFSLWRIYTDRTKGMVTYHESLQRHQIVPEIIIFFTSTYSHFFKTAVSPNVADDRWTGNSVTDGSRWLLQDSDFWNIYVREKHRSVVPHTHPNREPNPQPRHVLWPGIEPTAFRVVEWASLVRAPKF